jgi:hypothetical protein
MSKVSEGLGLKISLRARSGGIQSGGWLALGARGRAIVKEVLELPLALRTSSQE